MQTSDRRVDAKRGREILTGLHDIARDLQDEIDLLPHGSAGAVRLEKLRNSIIMDACIPLAPRYPLGGSE